MKYAKILFSALFVSGCSAHWSDQLIKEVEDGIVANFSNGLLDGYSTYGFDASFLNRKFLDYANTKRTKFLKKNLDDLPNGDLAVLFVVLKFADDSYLNLKPSESPCLRIQYGAVKKRTNDDQSFFASPTRKCFTFFFVDKSGEVHMLCVDCSRNPMRSHWKVGRDFEYGTRDIKIGIWDANIPDRNFPERILDGEYDEVFAVATDTPFNYMAYTTPEKAGWLKSSYGESCLKLVWRTSECMIFLPACLCPEDWEMKAGQSPP